MKKAFINIFLVALLFNLVTYSFLPDKVPLHFGSGGKPDSWGNKEAHLLIFLGMYVFLFLLFYFIPNLVFKVPSKWMNLPNKNYWLRPENRPRAKQMMEKLMWEFGIAIFLFLISTNVLTVSAMLSKPVKLNEPLFLVFLAVFLIYTVYWSIKIITGFKIPKDRI